MFPSVFKYAANVIRGIDTSLNCSTNRSFFSTVIPLKRFSVQSSQNFPSGPSSVTVSHGKLLRSTWCIFTFPVRFKTSTATLPKELSGIQGNISSLRTKTRTQRRKTLADEVHSNKGWNVAAYTTAEEYDLENLKIALQKQQLYELLDDMNNDYTVQDTGNAVEDVLHVAARYSVEDEPREMFFFREGTAVFWNVSDLEAANLLRFIRPYEHNSYQESLVLAEKESMTYMHSDSKKTGLCDGVILLKRHEQNDLEKYTFSNAISLSVKLGIWESSLEKYVESIEFITEDLKNGRKIRMSREEVLRKQGEIFALRHLINLSSDLLDTPDFYWDNEELENLYMQTVSYLSINRRTRVMNEKLNHCLELIELVSSHLSDKHHIRLEWMIIVLIMVEVAFEMLHFLHR